MTDENLRPIQEILDSGEFQSFIGLRENLHFEAKCGTPYDFSTPSGMYELAKDVSALANSSGGHLVIGLTETKTVGSMDGEVAALDLLEQGVLDARKLHGIVDARVYPSIAGLDVTWVASRADPKRGVVAVLVPPQLEDRKLFLVRNVVEAGQVQREIVVGIARRVDNANEPLTHDEVYRALQRGLSSTITRLESIEAKLDSVRLAPSDASYKLEQDVELLRARIAHMSTASG